jgi:cytochrome b561
MAFGNRPTGYTTAQITLHWIIAALVIFQLLLGDFIQPAYHAYRRGAEVTAANALWADIHVYVGLAVLVLAVLRLAIRLRHGVPPTPAGEGPLLRHLATATHVVLYATIFGLPVTGALAWYFDLGFMGEIHSLAKPVVIVAVGLHAAGALWQHFVLRSDVLVRMLRPRARA